MIKKIICLLLCTFSAYGMKQKKLIEKVMQHERGIFLINKIIEKITNTLPYKTHFTYAKTFPARIKDNPITIFKRLSYDFGYDHSAVRESGGSLASSLVFPCPDVFVETIKPLVKVTDDYETIIDHAVYGESKKHQRAKDEKDYTELAIKYPELFLAIDVYRVNNMDLKKIFVYDQFMKFYDFETVEDVLSRNSTLFSRISAEQKSRSSESIFRSAYVDIYNKIHGIIARHEVEGKSSLGDIYTCDDKEGYLNSQANRLNDYCDMVHESKRWKKQEEIVKKMRKDPRRFILFDGQASAYLKNHAWEQNNVTDQTIILEWGGCDVMSVIEPHNGLHDETLRNPSLYGQIKLIREQQEKALHDYEAVRKKAPHLVHRESLDCNQPITLEEATLLEDYGFYGITGLHSRKLLK